MRPHGVLISFLGVSKAGSGIGSMVQLYQMMQHVANKYLLHLRGGSCSIWMSHRPKPESFPFGRRKKMKKHKDLIAVLRHNQQRITPARQILLQYFIDHSNDLSLPE